MLTMSKLGGKRFFSRVDSGIFLTTGSGFFLACRILVKFARNCNPRQSDPATFSVHCPLQLNIQIKIFIC